MDQIK